MHPDETFRFGIPPELERHKEPLYLDVQLLEIEHAPEVPRDVAAPPQEGKKTALGVFYKILHKGQGYSDTPTLLDTVKVDYTGWTSDGKMIDSTI